MSVIPGSGSYKAQTTASSNAELNKNLRSLKEKICCLIDVETSSDTEFVPVYEFRHATAPQFSVNPADRLNYTVSGTTIIFNATYLGDNFASCAGVPDTYTDTINHFEYSDATGVHVMDNGTEFITVDYVNFPSKDIEGRINVGYSSGFKSSFYFKVTVSNLGVPSIYINLPAIQSNSNATAGGGTYSFLYYIQKQDLLEVWQSGVFQHYVNTSHVVTVPTCYLSYKPIESFTPLTFELEPPIYNTIEHALLNNDTLTVPANSANSVSYTIVGGVGDVTVGGVLTQLPVGINETIKATTLVNSNITITAPSGADTVYVTIKKF